MHLKDYLNELENFREELKREGNPRKNHQRSSRHQEDQNERQFFAKGGNVKHRNRFPDGGGVPKMQPYPEEDYEIYQAKRRKRDREFPPPAAAPALAPAPESGPYPEEDYEMYQAQRRKRDREFPPSAAAAAPPAPVTVGPGPALVGAPPPPYISANEQYEKTRKYVGPKFNKHHLYAESDDDDPEVAAQEGRDVADERFGPKSPITANTLLAMNGPQLKHFRKQIRSEEVQKKLKRQEDAVIHLLQSAPGEQAARARAFIKEKSGAEHEYVAPHEMDAILVGAAKPHKYYTSNKTGRKYIRPTHLQHIGFEDGLAELENEDPGFEDEDYGINW